MRGESSPGPEAAVRSATPAPTTVPASRSPEFAALAAEVGELRAEVARLREKVRELESVARRDSE